MTSRRAVIVVIEFREDETRVDQTQFPDVLLCSHSGEQYSFLAKSLLIHTRPAKEARILDEALRERGFVFKTA